MLKNFRLSTRIMALSLLNVAFFAIILAWLTPKIKAEIYKERYSSTRNLVESAYGVIAHYAKEAKSGSTTADEARRRSISLLKNLRCGNDQYFWINDVRLRMLMNPAKTELEGRDLSDFKDVKGRYVFREVAEVCRKDGGGFVDYYWNRPGSSDAVHKVSYVKAIPEWGWILGSGIYMDDVDTELEQLLRTVYAVAAAAMFVCLFLSYFMAVSISKPINRVAKNINRALDGTIDKILANSDQVASSSLSLAEGSAEQASSLEETSTALEEMASMTRQNADNARQADGLMQEAKVVIDEANQSMLDLTTSMDDISRASRETSKIIKTIDEIAFQTNLLALNAAVEAARAGEAGAGFAVVAEEVRNLAMRAAEAAKNTAGLIEGTVKRINEGSGLVTRTGGAFSEVAKNTLKVSELVSEIAAANNEQARGVDEISKSVSNMDKVVQKNAASAVQSSSAAVELNEKAEELKSVFKDLLEAIGQFGKNIKKNGFARTGLKLGKNGTNRLERHRKPAPNEVKPKVSPENVIPLEDDFGE